MPPFIPFARTYGIHSSYIIHSRYWINHAAPAVGVYADVLSPPRSVADVVHWLNYLSAVRYDDENRKGANTIGGSGGGNDYVDGGKGRRDSRARKYLAINAAVEATTLNERTLRLRPQDAFLRDNISPGDVLIVSVGGNDIALCPAPCTVASMAGLLCLPSACLSRGRSFGSVPVSSRLRDFHRDGARTKRRSPAFVLALTTGMCFAS